jgi:hypothetical protein
MDRVTGYPKHRTLALGVESSDGALDRLGGSPEPSPDAATHAARRIAKRDNCDVFVYNGEISRGDDLNFMNIVFGRQRHKKCLLILVTPGGDPDAAYKVSRYLQERYEIVELLISGFCKSAGTLIAMGAHRLVFAPYGELDPLDVQMFKEDKLSTMQSGLNISEALKSLEQSAINRYLGLIGSIMKSSGGVVSFATAAKAASDVLDALYSPIFGQIDPEDVGGRTRSMRIAADYGKRLDLMARNMKPGAIQKLAETYSSHSFVIDKIEATGLFKNVRDADELEMELVDALDECSRWPVGKEAIMDCLSCADDGEQNEIDRSEPVQPQPNGPDRAHSKGAGTATEPHTEPRAGRGRKRRSPAGDIRAT